jgi:phage host-nuclease inhibitor protein Gam
MVRTRVRAPAHQIYTTRDELETAMQRLGTLQRDFEALRLDMDVRLAAVRSEFMPRFTTNSTEQTLLLDSIRAYCETHRKELTNDGQTKTVHFHNGDVQWRLPGWSVVLAVGASTEAIIKWFRDRTKGLARFGIDIRRYIRVKEELNKEALLEDRTKLLALRNLHASDNMQPLELISFSNEEYFVIEPHESKNVDAVPPDETPSMLRSGGDV